LSEGEARVERVQLAAAKSLVSVRARGECEGEG
jgi:hypothetical protein